METEILKTLIYEQITMSEIDPNNPFNWTYPTNQNYLVAAQLKTPTSSTEGTGQRFRYSERVHRFHRSLYPIGQLWSAAA